MIVKVDDLDVEVDEQEWDQNQEKVIAEVRAARQAERIPGIPERDREPDYNTQNPDEAENDFSWEKSVAEKGSPLDQGAEERAEIESEIPGDPYGQGSE